MVHFFRNNTRMEYGRFHARFVRRTLSVRDIWNVTWKRTPELKGMLAMFAMQASPGQKHWIATCKASMKTFPILQRNQLPKGLPITPWSVLSVRKSLIATSFWTHISSPTRIVCHMFVTFVMLDLHKCWGWRFTWVNSIRKYPASITPTCHPR